MMAFCKDFNAATQAYKPEVPLRVLLSAYSDGTFKFSVRAPKTSWFLFRAAGVDKGADNPGKEIVGTVHVKQIYEIAKIKQQDSDILRRTPVEGVAKSIVATMASMGLAVDNSREGEPPAQE
eukprot:CAMPEP_0205832512 /NCGR_PEP_ID=MMETSP0206-20130828/47136_1 /ASSEMBLY_ACC=CAM_ASM_000279 /TAXON_ID=36767 /ORGANISM="Euplotes focardii, Strain TN1" /LENGTH=121 /DNA_ID=CAMNT_0053138105 /DNA_START=170 /DNA_END=535 /DNA_ORIENTATION=+